MASSSKENDEIIELKSPPGEASTVYENIAALKNKFAEKFSEKEPAVDEEKETAVDGEKDTESEGAVVLPGITRQLSFLEEEPAQAAWLPSRSCSTLAQRRTMRNQELDEVHRVRKQMKKIHSFSYVLNDGLANVSRKKQEAQMYFSIWKGSIKEIEGNLGSGVSTYFKVLVWLLKINVVCMVLGLGLIVTPGLILSESMDRTNDTTTYNKLDLECTNPDFFNGTEWYVGPANSLLQLLTGEGWMEATALFIGWYPTGNLTSEEHGINYNFPLAYFMVGCTYFIISLAVMASNISKLFKQSATETIDNKKAYTSLVLAGWDYTIHKESTGILKKTSISKSLKEELTSDVQEQIERTLETKIGIFILRIFTWGLCVGAMVGCVYIYIELIMTDSSEDTADSTDHCGELINTTTTSLNISDLGIEQTTEILTSFWSTYSPSIFVSLSNMIFPILFSIMGNFEMYQFQSTRITVTLARSFVMKLFSIGTYLYILYEKTKPSGKYLDEGSWQNENNTLYYNCWENYVGSRLYQLCMVDFVIFCSALFVTEFLRGFIVGRSRFLYRKVGKPEFDIPKEVLDLCYKQMIFWAGFFFCPLMPTIAVIEVVLIFYLKKFSSLQNVVPPQTVILTSQSSSTVNALFLISIIFVFVIIGLVIFNFHPTATCGPFQGESRFTNPLSYVIDGSGVFKEYIVNNLKVTSIVIVIVIIVALIIYYYKSLAASRNLMVDLLKEQIKIEKFEKKELIKLIQPNIYNNGQGGEEEHHRAERKVVPHSKMHGMRRHSRVHRFANPAKALKE